MICHAALHENFAPILDTAVRIITVYKHQTIEGRNKLLNSCICCRSNYALVNSKVRLLFRQYIVHVWPVQWYIRMLKTLENSSTTLNEAGCLCRDEHVAQSKGQNDFSELDFHNCSLPINCCSLYIGQN